jgi:hypothetical protein
MSQSASCAALLWPRRSNMTLRIRNSSAALFAPSRISSASRKPNLRDTLLLQHKYLKVVRDFIHRTELRAPAFPRTLSLMAARSGISPGPCYSAQTLNHRLAEGREGLLGGARWIRTAGPGCSNVSGHFLTVSVSPSPSMSVPEAHRRPTGF